MSIYLIGSRFDSGFDELYDISVYGVEYTYSLDDLKSILPHKNTSADVLEDLGWDLKTFKLVMKAIDNIHGFPKIDGSKKLGILKKVDKYYAYQTGDKTPNYVNKIKDLVIYELK